MRKAEPGWVLFVAVGLGVTEGHFQGNRFGRILLFPSTPLVEETPGV